MRVQFELLYQFRPSLWSIASQQYKHMNDKTATDSERLQRYMVRINRLLGQQDNPHSPWRGKTPKRIKTLGPMVQRIDTYINYEQSFCVLSRTVNLKKKHWMGEFIVSLKGIESPPRKSTTPPQVQRVMSQQKTKPNTILALRIRSLFYSNIKCAFTRTHEYQNNNSRQTNKDTNSCKINIPLVSIRPLIGCLEGIFRVRITSGMVAIIKYHGYEVRQDHQFVLTINKSEVSKFDSTKLQLFIARCRSELVRLLNKVACRIVKNGSLLSLQKDSNKTKISTMVSSISRLLSIKATQCSLVFFSQLSSTVRAQKLKDSLELQKPRVTTASFVQSACRLHPLIRIQQRLTTHMHQSFTAIVGYSRRFLVINQRLKTSPLNSRLQDSIIEDDTEHQWEKLVCKGVMGITRVCKAKRIEYLNKSFTLMVVLVNQSVANDQIKMDHHSCYLPLLNMLSRLHLRRIRIGFLQNSSFQSQDPTSGFIYQDVQSFIENQNQTTRQLNYIYQQICQSLNLSQVVGIRDSTELDSLVNKTRRSLF